MYVNTNNIDMAKLAINKSLLKEYNTSTSPRTVYLKDGDEYQIQLYNPTDDDIAATIYIDNKALSNQLVIRPGERIWLERYLDVAKRFKFSTYSVEDNVETENAISHNGEIRIQFFKKIQKLQVSYDPYLTVVNNDKIKYHTTNKLYSNGCSSEYLTTCVNDCIPKGITEISANIASLCNDSIKTSDVTLSLNAENTRSIETGRTGKGSYSSQKFENVNEDFNTWAFKTEEFKILPISRKPTTSEDIEKLYCCECGRKLKTKYKFCPYCGTRID